MRPAFLLVTLLVMTSFVLAAAPAAEAKPTPPDIGGQCDKFHWHDGAVSQGELPGYHWHPCL